MSWAVTSTTLLPQGGVDPHTASAAQYNVVHNITSPLVNPCDRSEDDFGNLFVIDETSDTLYRRDADATLTAIPVGSIALAACLVNPAGTICYFKDANNQKVYEVRLKGRTRRTSRSGSRSK